MRARGKKKGRGGEGRCRSSPFLPFPLLPFFALNSVGQRSAPVMPQLDAPQRPPGSRKLAALAEFAAGAGHEINNPLTVISGRAQLLLRGETDPQRRRDLAVIHVQAMRITEMIADLRLFATPPELQRQQVDVAAFGPRGGAVAAARGRRTGDDARSDHDRDCPDFRGSPGQAGSMALSSEMELSPSRPSTSPPTRFNSRWPSAPCARTPGGPRLRWPRGSRSQRGGRRGADRGFRRRSRHRPEHRPHLFEPFYSARRPAAVSAWGSASAGGSRPRTAAASRSTAVPARRGIHDLSAGGVGRSN